MTFAVKCVPLSDLTTLGGPYVSISSNKNFVVDLASVFLYGKAKHNFVARHVATNMYLQPHELSIGPI